MSVPSGSSLQSRLWSWLVLAVAIAIVANVVWQLVRPLIVPASVVLVGAVAAGVLFRMWRARHFW